MLKWLWMDKNYAKAANNAHFCSYHLHDIKAISPVSENTH